MLKDNGKTPLGLLASDPVFDEAPVDDIDQILKLTQRARLKLLTEITKSSGYTDDPKMLNVVVKTLDSIDKQSLTVKKISSDEGMNNRNQIAMGAIIEALNDPKKLQAYNQSLDSVMVSRQNDIIVPDDAETIVVIEGELSAVGNVEDYKSFMARMRAEMADS